MTSSRFLSQAGFCEKLPTFWGSSNEELRQGQESLRQCLERSEWLESKSQAEKLIPTDVCAKFGGERDKTREGLRLCDD